MFRASLLSAPSCEGAMVNYVNLLKEVIEAGSRYFQLWRTILSLGPWGAACKRTIKQGSEELKSKQINYSL
jgi:hypothetical protein